MAGLSIAAGATALASAASVASFGETLANDVTSWISGPAELGVTIVPASLGLAASLGGLAAVAVVTFQRTDV